MKKPALSEATEASIEKGPTGFGFRFGGPKDREEGRTTAAGVFIASLKYDGSAYKWAESDVGPGAKWVEGQQLLEINGTDLTFASKTELKELLKKVGETMSFRFIPNLKLYNTYTGKVWNPGKKKNDSDDQHTATASPTDTSTKKEPEKFAPNTRVTVKGYNTCYGTVKFYGEHHKGKGNRPGARAYCCR